MDRSPGGGELHRGLKAWEGRSSGLLMARIIWLSVHGVLIASASRGENRRGCKLGNRGEGDNRARSGHGLIRCRNRVGCAVSIPSGVVLRAVGAAGRRSSAAVENEFNIAFLGTSGIGAAVFSFGVGASAEGTDSGISCSVVWRDQTSSN